MNPILPLGLSDNQFEALMNAFYMKLATEARHEQYRRSILAWEDDGGFVL